jgi:hypothetical protein
MVRQLFNIMHQTIQLPLPVHLRLSAQRKAVQSLVAAQIAKHWFHRRKATRDYSPPHVGIDFHLHSVDMIFCRIAFALEEGNLSYRRLPGFAQTFLAPLARHAILFGSTELHRRIAFICAIRPIAIEPLARWANAVRVIGCQGEVRRLETVGLFYWLGFVPERVRLGSMHMLIGIAFIPLAVTVVGHIGIDVLLRQCLEVGVRMVAGISGNRLNVE